jgi:hypothetical protein
MAGKMSNLAAGMGHPDENVLAAYVERSLAAHEREHVLRHLSACSRCRDVVFLTQQAEPGSFIAQPDTASDREDARRGFGWRIAWIAVPAMAAVLLAVVSVRWYEGSHSLKNASPAAAPSQTVAMSQPVALPPTAQSANAAPVNVVPENVQKKTKAPPIREGKRRQAVQGDLTGQNTTVIAGTAANPAPASQPLPQVSETVAVAAAPVQTETQAQSISQAIPQEAPQPAPMAVRPVTANGRAAVSPVFSANHAAQGSATAGAVVAAPILLPSGLQAVSLVHVTGRHVALDQDGNLFLRANADSAWTQIAKQWTGKAASLRTDPSMQPAARFSMMMKKAPEAGAQETAAPPTLRLINDTGHVWTSVDSGQTWHPLPHAPPQQK